MEPTPPGSASPSQYELDAWNRLVAHHIRSARRDAGKAAKQPGKHLAASASPPTSNPLLTPTSTTPHDKNVTHDLGDAVIHTLASVARLGLGAKGMARKFRRRGHDVKRLHDIRSLDLADVEDARWRPLGLAYSAYSGAAGAGAGLLMTGGELGLASGIAAVPGAVVIGGVIVADSASLLALASRATAHVALSYGYNPADPTEKEFVASIAKLAFARSQLAKQAALTDIIKVSNLLGRGASWQTLEKTITGVIARSVAKRIGARLTKGNLGKLVPVAGMVIGGVMNFRTVDRTVDAAIIAYRTRFLIEKYPQLAAQLGGMPPLSDAPAGPAIEPASTIASAPATTAHLDGPPPHH